MRYTNVDYSGWPDPRLYQSNGIVYFHYANRNHALRQVSDAAMLQNAVVVIELQYRNIDNVGLRDDVLRSHGLDGDGGDAVWVLEKHDFVI